MKDKSHNRMLFSMITFLENQPCKSSKKGANKPDSSRVIKYILHQALRGWLSKGNIGSQRANNTQGPKCLQGALDCSHIDVYKVQGEA